MNTTGTGTVPRPRDPIHDRPATPSMDDLRHKLQTVHGAILHAAHLAEQTGNSAVAGAHYADARIIADLLWARS